MDFKLLPKPGGFDLSKQIDEICFNTSNLINTGNDGFCNEIKAQKRTKSAIDQLVCTVATILAKTIRIYGVFFGLSRGRICVGGMPNF